MNQARRVLAIAEGWPPPRIARGVMLLALGLVLGRELERHAEARALDHAQAEFSRVYVNPPPPPPAPERPRSV